MAFAFVGGSRVFGTFEDTNSFLKADQPLLCPFSAARLGKTRQDSARPRGVSSKVPFASISAFFRKRRSTTSLCAFCQNQQISQSKLPCITDTTAVHSILAEVRCILMISAHWETKGELEAVYVGRIGSLIDDVLRHASSCS